MALPTEIEKPSGGGGIAALC